jgi:spore maturation protein CgeB
VTHIGGYGKIHDERNQILEEVSKKKKIDFWGYANNNLKKDSNILKNYHGQIWGLDMYQILHDSKITLSKHITEVAGDYANNMTLFEATGCGCMLIVDYKKNLNEVFKIGQEIETYKSIEELEEKIQYYLKHEKKRKEIANAGQKRTLNEHTWGKRIQRINNIFHENF